MATTTTRDGWHAIRDHYDQGEPDPTEVRDDHAEAAYRAGTAAALADIERHARDDQTPAPTFTLAELTEREAERYEAMGTAPAGLFGRTLRALAFKVRLVDADTAADYEARLEVLDDDIRSEWEAIGFEAGRSSCPCRCALD